MKRLITQKDLDANPILKELGIKLGWAVSVTKDEVSLGKSRSNESTQTAEGGESESGEGDGEGGNGGAGNPGNKPPFTPPPNP